MTTFGVLLCVLKGTKWHSKQHPRGYMAEIVHRRQAVAPHLQRGCKLFQQLLHYVCMICTKDQQLVQTSLLVQMQCGCIVLELCWITANQTPVIPSLHHMSWQSHTQSCRRQKSFSSSSCLLHMHHTHHTCFCPAPEERKKLSQFQAPNLVLNGCGVIIYLHFSSGFGGGLNLSRLLAEKQVTPAFFSALGSSSS